MVRAACQEQTTTGSHAARISNSKKAPLGRLSTLVGRAGYTRLILRLTLRVTASGDAKLFPTILSNLRQVRTQHELQIAKRRL